ncbi:zinc finger CCHC domain-containing protein 14 isoform X3 [Kryptolebias marmoratus]|uniref:zinc finger CCHC domain-containing protein 14 isoform X3 n=1 Tax=Kryptolebias marmoratus TaxID=37003 RepID=UPI0007F93C72|nr:zinc finger CCHC domain-containing protein 14 isoform X3 [Kryptolebias marmoratus]
MVESRSCVQREEVFRWFSCLTSAHRAEFLCGLLDLCVPVELRFLGSCLEDLARKDYHSLRDAEIKANNPADLSGLTNVTDEVVRSKLLVSLALLGSDSREAAGVLYRTLTHIDTVINNYGLALNDGRTEEQFLLLFTMASNHPAFSFHQKQVLRQQLAQIQNILQANRGGGGGEASAAGTSSDRAAQPHHHHHYQTTPVPQASMSPPASSPPSAGFLLPLCTCWSKNQNREAASAGSGSGSGDQAIRPELASPHSDLRSPPSTPALPAGPGQEAPAKNHQGKAGRAAIDRVVLRRVAHKPEDAREYVFEVSGSDGSVSTVVKTQQEVADLTSQLSQEFPDEGLEKFFPQSLEVNSRYLPALPCHVLQHPAVQLFFTSNGPLSPPSCSLPAAPTCPLAPSSNLGCMVQYRGANRAVYRVASVQPVVSTHSSVLMRSTPHLLPPPLPPPQPLSAPTRSSAAGGGDASSQPLHPYPLPPYLHLSHPPPRSPSQPAPTPPAQSQPGSPEQNGILDWLRRLRLHKYYPVFKQLTMEEFLGLTEEDLNKYDLTQGAKKKLKTQLELQKSAEEMMKMEKRPCGGIARVTPSSHMGPPAHPSSAGDLHVEVDGVPLHHPVSADCSSSCSPRTPQCCDPTFDRSRDAHRRVLAPDGSEKDRSCLFILNSTCPAGSSRPTAQVLPVQTEPAPPLPPSCSSHPPFGLLQTPFPARILTAPRKPRPAPLSTEDRTKVLGAVSVGAGFGSGPGVGVGVGVGVAARLESQFTGLTVDGPSGLQEAGLCRGLMVETSSALTSTSNSLHHVSQPPLLFHLSSSPSGYYSYPPSSSSSSSTCTSRSGSSGGAGGYVSMATTSTVPVAAVPGNSYYQPTSSPAPSACSAPSSDQSPAHNPSTCVCSSCGCRGNCGAYGALPGYAAAGYLQPFSSGPPLFTLGPLLHLSPFVAPSSAAGPVAPPFPYPMMVPPPLYRHSPTSHDQQQGFGFYQPHGLMGNQKRAAGNVSCYNCGASGHRADECKQPPMDSTPQGTFRLKYTPHSQSKDSGD